MIHETKRIQTVCAWWRFVLAIGALGGVLYHAVAAIENIKEVDKTRSLRYYQKCGLAHK